MQTTNFNEVLDMHIGMCGTKKREAFKQGLKLELSGEAIKIVKKAKNLKQEQLGELVKSKEAKFLNWKTILAT